MEALIQHAIDRSHRKRQPPGRSEQTSAKLEPPGDADEARLHKLVEALRIHVLVVGFGQGGVRIANICSEELDSSLVDPAVCGAETDLQGASSRCRLIPAKLDGAGQPVNASEILQHVEKSDLLFLAVNSDEREAYRLAEFVARTTHSLLTMGLWRPMIVSLVTTPLSDSSGLPQPPPPDAIAGLSRASDVTIVLSAAGITDLITQGRIDVAPWVVDELAKATVECVSQMVVFTHTPARVLDFNDFRAVFYRNEIAQVGWAEGLADQPDEVVNRVLISAH